MKVAISQIRLDGGTQTRAEIDLAVAADYADRFREGVTFPPVVVFYDGSTHWLADGFHRVTGAKSAGLAEIDADVRQGTRRDAILFSVGANAEHGKPRTQADRRRAVEVLLRDSEWSLNSDNWIAKAARVDHKTVARVREHLGIPKSDERKTSDGRVMNTVNIGRRDIKPDNAPTPRADDVDDDLPDIEREPDVYDPEPTPIRRDPPPRTGWGASDVSRFTSETVIWLRGVQEEARRRFGAVDPRFVRESRTAAQDIVLETIETLRALLPEDAPAPKFTIVRGGK